MYAKTAMLVPPVDNMCAESVHRCAHIYDHCTSVLPTSDALQCTAAPGAGSSSAVPVGPSSSDDPEVPASIAASDASSFGASSFGATKVSMADDSDAPNAAAAEGQSPPSSSPAPAPPPPPLPPPTAPPSKVVGAETQPALSMLPPRQPSSWSSGSTGRYSYFAIIHPSCPVLSQFRCTSCRCV